MFIVNKFGPFERGQRNSNFVFHQISKHWKTIKALDLRSRAFISFLVFGNPDRKHSPTFMKLDICCISRSLDCVVWKEKYIIFGILYRQHNSPESFQSYLDEVLERISSNDETVHIMGDFNLSLFNVETFCKFTKDFLLS